MMYHYRDALYLVAVGLVLVALYALYTLFS